MKFDNELYTKIYKAVSQIAERKGFDIQQIEDITQDVALRVVETFKKPGRREAIQNEDAYIYSIIIRIFIDHYRRNNKRKQFNLKDVDWLNDTVEPYDLILEDQARSFPGIIDDYVRKHPKSFTKQNKQLWEIFKLQKYTVQEMMVQMGMTKPAFIHTAKARLIERIIKIYKEIAESDPD